MTIDNKLIDNLLKDYKKLEDIIGENGLLKQLTKQLLERRWRRSWIGPNVSINAMSAAPVARVFAHRAIAVLPPRAVHP